VKAAVDTRVVCALPVRKVVRFKELAAALTARPLPGVVQAQLGSPCGSPCADIVVVLDALVVDTLRRADAAVAILGGLAARTTTHRHPSQNMGALLGRCRRPHG